MHACIEYVRVSTCNASLAEHESTAPAPQTQCCTMTLSKWLPPLLSIKHNTKNTKITIDVHGCDLEGLYHNYDEIVLSICSNDKTYWYD